jgi:hypothetical protein
VGRFRSLPIESAQVPGKRVPSGGILSTF